MKMFFEYFLIALLVFNVVRFCINYFSYTMLKNNYGETTFDNNDFELTEEQFYTKCITAQNIRLAMQNKYNSAILHLILIIITMLALVSWFM